MSRRRGFSASAGHHRTKAGSCKLYSSLASSFCPDFRTRALPLHLTVLKHGEPLAAEQLRPEHGSSESSRYSNCGLRRRDAMRPESSQRSCCLAIGSPLSFMWWPAEALESQKPRPVGLYAETLSTLASHASQLLHAQSGATFSPKCSRMYRVRHWVV